MPYSPDLVHVWAKIDPHLGETVPDTLWQKHCSMKKKDKILSPGRDKAILAYPGDESEYDRRFLPLPSNSPEKPIYLEKLSFLMLLKLLLLAEYR